MMQTILTTERLCLRPITEEDVEDIYEYTKEANVGPNAGWKPLESLEETLQIMKLIFIAQENVFGIVLKETGKMIGSIGLIKDPKREFDGTRMLGYAIGEHYWGNGYMTEAAKAIVKYGFDTLGLHLISAYCYPFNERSKGIIKKLGFEYEGKLSLCEKLYNGNVYDNECYALQAIH